MYLYSTLTLQVIQKMSNSVSNSFVRQYERDLKHVFQRNGAVLRPTVRFKTGVVGESTTFQVIGKGTATTKARNGVITPMNVDHTPVICTLEDFYAGDYVDKLDESKLTISEREAIAQAGASSLGRKVDEQIIDKMDGTTQTAVTWIQTNSAAIRNSALEMGEALDNNDVPNDGQKYALVSPRAWSSLMTVEEFSSADFVGGDGMTFTKGTAMMGVFKMWNGIRWASHTGVTGKGTNAVTVYAWHKNAVGYAAGAHSNNSAVSDSVGADIQWISFRAAHFVNNMMSGGSCLIDDTGVIKGSFDDTLAIPTS